MTNGYMMFVKHNRKDIAAKHPSLKITEIGKKMGEAWRGLSQAEQEKYKKLAAEAPKAVKKAKPISGDKPKRPLSSYMKFIKAKRAEVTKAHPNLKVTELGKIFGEMWRSLSEKDKALYK